MYVELGTGNKRFSFYNADKHHEIDIMMRRLVAAYKEMGKIGYPSMENTERSCTLIFSRDRHAGAAINIRISTRPCGIYVNDCAYHKQIARRLYAKTGFDIHQTNTCNVDPEIGIGGLDASTQGFVILKDALLGLAVI